MPPPNLRAKPPSDFIPVWIREPWPILAAIGLVAIAFFVVGNPLMRLERLWTDLLLRQRSQAHLAPKPDGRIFLVGLETKNLAGDSTVAAEYKTYAEIVNMLSDLRASVVALDFMMVRGRPEDAQEVLAAIRSSGRVVLAQARTPEMLARSFLFAPPGEFEEGRVNIAADSDGVHRRYAYGISEAHSCLPSLALAAYLKWQDARPEFACVGSSELTWKELRPDQKSLVDRTLTRQPGLLNFRSSFVEKCHRGFKYVRLSELPAGY